MDKQDVIRRLGPQAMELLMATFQSFKKIAPNRRQAKIRIRNTPDALEQAWHLNLLSQRVDAYLQLGDRKFAAPAKFAKVWEEFNDDYRDVIVTSGSLAITSNPEGRRVVENAPSIFDLLKQATGELIPDDTLFDYWDWLASTGGRPTPPYFHAETEFRPGHDDPIRLVEMAVDYFSDQDWKAEDQDFFNNSKKVWDAWDYLKDTVGLDTAGLWKRWTTVPMILSQHIGHPTISDLYDETVRCFTFGQFAAAMAMCRALLEDVLGRLYGVYSGELHDRIIEAENRYGELRKHQLVQLKNAANSVLHDHSKWRQRSKEAEKLVRQFLEALKAVIEDADVRKKP